MTTSRQDAILSQFELADMRTRHERHQCIAGHFDPGICAHCQAPWPCDARLLLNSVLDARTELAEANDANERLVADISRLEAHQ